MTDKMHTLTDIFKSTEYALDIFTQQEIDALEIIDKGGKPYVRDFVSKMERPAKPEEVVRQLFVYRLINTYKYPTARIALEKGVYFGSSVAEKRADIVILDKDKPDMVYLIVEAKKPKRKDGVEQLKSYCNAEGAPIAVWTNGGEIVTLHRRDPNDYESLTDIPRADQTLTEVINEQITIDWLKANNDLLKGDTTLKKIIEDLEDLVLANAGVDAFDEVFKLVYAKLFDEWRAERTKDRIVQFRAVGTDKELQDKINWLFNEAKRQWPGVFMNEERIELSASHLATCVSFLQKVALFNSNLQVIDEAFEYLVVKVSKGEKGQYFTPRHVIDMCVKMMNPKYEEYMIDTAAGSCGFTIHTFIHVWGGSITASGPDRLQAEYASEKVYGLDFDARSVKIAKAINLIAGDGKTNVYRMNSLDPRSWDEDGRVGLRPRLRRFWSDATKDDWNQQNFREFEFDIVMTNPPFAGDIKDSRLLHQYELAKQWKSVDVEKLADPEAREKWQFEDKGKWNPAQSRDILFIERNLEFLRPGGRMAIVLPQGRFNNTSDAATRHWISTKARILAVVGLHGNTFKPHTGTKTSVLFLQKWNDDPDAGPLCPVVEDYPIFFGTSERSGKDNSGGYVYVIDDDGKPKRDSHGHMIVNHDLDEIANVFAAFAKRQGFSFGRED